jgi:ribose transport system substrate-binding protein
LALVGVLAGCGSSSSSSSGSTGASSGSSGGSGGTAAAQANITAYSALPKFTLKAPSFDIHKIAGKTIFNIPISSAVPYVVSVDQQAAALAKKYGAKWVEYTNQGTPTQWTAGINQAISQHASVIVLAQGINAQLILPAIQKAKAAGIPVVITHTYENGQQTTAPPTGPGAALNKLVTAYVNVPFWQAGILDADWAITQTKGKADAVIFSSPDVPPSDGLANAIVNEFKKNCPSCKTKVINLPLADWATKIAPDTQSAVQSDPGVNWIIPIYDSMGLYAAQGITAAGKTGSVQIASYNGTPAVMKLIQTGNVYAMDAGENISWLAYATIDQVGRVITGAPIVKSGNEQTALRVFSKSNVDQAGTPPNANQGYGNAYVAGYDKLWGLR